MVDSSGASPRLSPPLSPPLSPGLSSSSSSISDLGLNHVDPEGFQWDSALSGSTSNLAAIQRKIKRASLHDLQLKFRPNSIRKGGGRFGKSAMTRSVCDLSGSAEGDSPDDHMTHSFSSLYDKSDHMASNGKDGVTIRSGSRSLSRPLSCHVMTTGDYASPSLHHDVLRESIADVPPPDEREEAEAWGESSVIGKRTDNAEIISSIETKWPQMARVPREKTLKENKQLSKPLQLCFINDTSSDDDATSPAALCNNNNVAGSPEIIQHKISFDGQLPQETKRLQEDANKALSQVPKMAKMQMDIEKSERKRILKTNGSIDPTDPFDKDFLECQSAFHLRKIIRDLETEIARTNIALIDILLVRDELQLEQRSKLVDVEDNIKRSQELALCMREKQFQNVHFGANAKSLYTRSATLTPSSNYTSKPTLSKGQVKRAQSIGERLSNFFTKRKS